MGTSKNKIFELEQALLEINEEKAESIIIESVKNRNAALVAGTLISDTLTKIGDSWERGDLSLSQVYMSGIICEKIIDKILPPQSPKRKNQPATAIGVFEDYHLLGKRIIYSTLRASGVELTDLGGGLTSEKIVEKVKTNKIKILMLSVLMLPSALRLKGLIQQVKNFNVTVIVGGAPFRFDENLATEIGADYCGKDSSEALQIINKLMEG